MSTVTVHRVQLPRRAGWRLPANTVSVVWPTRWANPFRPPHRGVEVNRVVAQALANPAAVIGEPVAA